METGNPFILFKDACNSKSNQQNLGTIKSSNLCTEIVEFSSPEETAVCNLASIALPRFVSRTRDQPSAGSPGSARSGSSASGRFSHGTKLVGSLAAAGRFFDHEKLAEVTAQVTRNLNRIIDVNFYPTPEALRSNMRHRPIGIGVQGLADTFILLGMPFESPEAQQLNKEVRTLSRALSSLAFRSSFFCLGLLVCAGRPLFPTFPVQPRALPLLRL